MLVELLPEPFGSLVLRTRECRGDGDAAEYPTTHLERRPLRQNARWIASVRRAENRSID